MVVTANRFLRSQLSRSLSWSWRRWRDDATAVSSPQSHDDIAAPFPGAGLSAPRFSHELAGALAARAQAEAADCS